MAEEPNGDAVKLSPYWGRLLRDVFLLGIGWVGAQFFLFPIQQTRQDDKLAVMEETQRQISKKVEMLEQQHQKMLAWQEQQDRLREEEKKRALRR